MFLDWEKYKKPIDVFVAKTSQSIKTSQFIRDSSIWKNVASELALIFVALVLLLSPEVSGTFC